MNREETVKRALTAITFAVACLTTASAQEATVPSDQRREIEGILQQQAQALNKGDSKALTAFFKANATRIDIAGIAHFQSQIEARLQDLVKGGIKDVSIVPQLIEPIEGGKAILVITSYTATIGGQPVQGNSLGVYEQEGSGWKIRASASSRLAK
jgi:ketosteroid isomerase-like protein